MHRHHSGADQQCAEDLRATRSLDPTLRLNIIFSLAKARASCTAICIESEFRRMDSCPTNFFCRGRRCSIPKFRLDRPSKFSSMPDMPFRVTNSGRPSTAVPQSCFGKWKASGARTSSRPAPVGGRPSVRAGPTMEMPSAGWPSAIRLDRLGERRAWTSYR
jgi:hypothetical protein